MTEIVSIRGGSRETIEARPEVASMVEILENALADVRSGKIDGVAIASFCAEKGAGTLWATKSGTHPIALVGCVAILLADMTGARS